MVEAVVQRTVVGSDGRTLAIIVRKSDERSGIFFVTPHEFQQQVALMRRPAGEEIAAHSHLPVPRAVQGTHEVLIVRSGRMRVDIFENDRALVSSEEVSSGDVVILVDGGHGFEMLEDCDFVEVKQGPYQPGSDKIVFATSAMR
jgi:hypothetical protein